MFFRVGTLHANFRRTKVLFWYGSDMRLLKGWSKNHSPISQLSQKQQENRIKLDYGYTGR